MNSSSLVVLALAMAGAAFPASAQTVNSSAGSTAPAAEDDDAVRDIVVTAAKRGSESLQKVPIAISAYSGADLAKASIQDVASIDMKSPGLIFTLDSGSIQPFIRGIGVIFANPGLEAPVAVYVDDVYIQNSYTGNFDLFDASSVQTLKGPQGTLYGRNATGGAILIENNKPVMENTGSISAELGNLAHRRIEPMLNMKLSDVFAVRVAGLYSHEKGWIRNPVTGLRFNGHENYAVRGKALYDNDRFTALLSGEYTETKTRAGLRQAFIGSPLCFACNLFGSTPPPGKYETYQNSQGVAKIKNFFGSLHLDAQLSDTLDLSSVTGYRHLDGAGLGSDEGMFGGAPAGRSIAILNALVNEVSGDYYQQEFRVTSHFDGPLNFLAGISGAHSSEVLDYQINGAAFRGLTQRTRNRLKTDTASAFLELYYDLSAQLRLTAGGRYNYDKKRSLSTPSGIAAGPDFRYRTSSKNATPRIVLEYKPDGDQNYYASYQSGFKSGGFNFPAFANNPNDTLKPEKVNSWELGAKNRFLDGRLRTNLALFYYRYKAIQVSIVDPLRGSLKANIGNARGYGAEFDMQFAPTDIITFGAGYGYLNAEYTRYPNVRLIGPGVANPATGSGAATTIVNGAGSPLQRSPKHTLYGSVELHFPMSDAWDARLNTTARYTSSYIFNPLAGGPLRLDRQKGFTMVNMTGSVGQTEDGVRVGFYIDNLFDTFYVDNASTNAFGAYRGPAKPRTYGLTASYAF